MLPVSGTNTITESNLGWKGFILDPGYNTPQSKTKVEAQGRILETGTEAECMVDHCSLAYFLGLSQIMFHISQTHLLRDGTAHSGLCPAPSISYSENAS